MELCNGDTGLLPPSRINTSASMLAHDQWQSTCLLRGNVRSSRYTISGPPCRRALADLSTPLRGRQRRRTPRDIEKMAEPVGSFTKRTMNTQADPEHQVVDREETRRGLVRSSLTLSKIFVHKLLCILNTFANNKQLNSIGLLLRTVLNEFFRCTQFRLSIFLNDFSECKRIVTTEFLQFPLTNLSTSKVLRHISTSALHGPGVATAGSSRPGHIVDRCSAALPAAILRFRATLSLRARTGLLRSGLWPARLGQRRSPLRPRLRPSGLATARSPGHGVQSARPRHRALPSPSHRQRHLRGDPLGPGDHYPSAQSVLRADGHSPGCRWPAQVSQRGEYGEYCV
ncbi:unnamed protein product [Trichogramma brassicae]|uniref:Uncharacterized protein n=1 Tax=Trichogramma brassicae TaxID=86971 RepID=A0A6H5ICY8_9HYME|nr:unnamed protein product [Trichogramma brassicae]